MLAKCLAYYLALGEYSINGIYYLYISKLHEGFSGFHISAFIEFYLNPTSPTLLSHFLNMTVREIKLLIIVARTITN